MTKPKSKYQLKNLFHSHWTNTEKFGVMKISETNFKMDYGNARAYWIKCQSVTVDFNLCGFCLN